MGACGVHGVGRGAKLGFPTVNLERIDTLLPADGIYAARAWTGGRVWPSAVSIGSNSTFNDDLLKVEAHLIGADEDFYGAEVQLEFLARLRELKKFESVEELVAQIERDISSAVKIAEQVSCGEF